MKLIQFLENIIAITCACGVILTGSYCFVSVISTIVTRLLP